MNDFCGILKIKYAIFSFVLPGQNCDCQSRNHEGLGSVILNKLPERENPENGFPRFKAKLALIIPNSG